MDLCNCKARRKAVVVIFDPQVRHAILNRVCKVCFLKALLNNKSSSFRRVLDSFA